MTEHNLVLSEAKTKLIINYPVLRQTNEVVPFFNPHNLCKIGIKKKKKNTKKTKETPIILYQVV